MSGPVIDPEFRLSEAIPELGRLCELMDSRDWPAAEALLGDFGVRSEDEMAVAASVVANIRGVEFYLDKVILDDPSDVGAKALRACRRITLGWEARTHLMAEHVSEKQFKAFRVHLLAAEAELIELCAIVPWMALPWHLRLLTARGLSLGQSETRRRYDRLAANQPHHYSAQSAMLQMLCPKWGGTWEDTFGFARSASASAPEGSACHGLVADAHFERWAASEAKGRAAYVAEPTIRAEISAAAQRSVWHPAFAEKMHRINLHSLFAVLFSEAGDQNEARRHFEALGNYADENRFGYFGDAAKDFRKRRATAMAKGRA
jgi:hypothetical protein